MSNFDHVDGFVTTGARPFRHDAFPMRLFQKAKRLGVWDPMGIDLARDTAAWQRRDGDAPMGDEEREAVLGTISVFIAGEEAVTLDLLPLIGAIAREGRIEEEMYLTTFLFEEAKHTELFARYLREVCEADASTLSRFHGPTYRRIFYEELPRTMWALRDEPTPRNQLRASVTYNMIVEGVLAETGYYGFLYSVEELGEEAVLPGLVEGIRLLRQDEARHMAYGIYLISRLVAADASLWADVEARMNELLPLAMGLVNERMQMQLDAYGRLPDDLEPQKMMGYAMGQYQKRMARLQKAREQSLEEIEKIALDTDVDAA